MQDAISQLFIQKAILESFKIFPDQPKTPQLKSSSLKDQKMPARAFKSTIMMSDGLTDRVSHSAVVCLQSKWHINY